VVKHSRRANSEYQTDEGIIAIRNSRAHDAHLTADIALPEFIDRCFPVSEKRQEIKSKLDQHRSVLEEQFGRSIAKTQKLCQNKYVAHLLTERAWVWGKKGVDYYWSQRLMDKIDGLVSQYENAVEKDPGMDPFSSDGTLAAEFKLVVAEAKTVLR
jgi:hypothetical protein